MRSRQAAVVLELIIALPVLILATLAVVELGLWMSNKEKLEMAARIGAEAAAETAGLNMMANLNGSEIQEKVHRYLQNAGIPINNVEITLSYVSMLGASPMLLTENPPGISPPPALPAPPSGYRYVRLVVSVPASDLAPNLLGYFGFDLQGLYTQQAQTRYYEGS